MLTPQVTILIPNYKTLKLTQLCLRLIRKYTDPQLAKVIVIDNDSADESLTYLRTLKWIELIERRSVPGETPVVSHGRALDLGLEHVVTPYVLSIHTDTLVRHKEWLPFLLNHLQSYPERAAVGSWKLESKSYGRKLLKRAEGLCQKITYYLINKENRSLEEFSQEHYYLRSHCALYRTNLIRKYQTGFSDGEQVAGKVMYHKFVKMGHEMLFLASETLLNYMDHINHATTVLNPELSRHKKSIIKGKRRIEKSLALFNATQILKDSHLDL